MPPHTLLSLALALALSLCAAAAQAADTAGAAPATHQAPQAPQAVGLSAADQRLEAGLARLLALRDQRQAVDCLAERAAHADDLRGNWSRQAHAIWTGTTGCLFWTAGENPSFAPPTAEAIEAAYAPMLAHFAQMPLALRLQRDYTIDAQLRCWDQLRHFGHIAHAEALELQLLDRLLLQAGAAHADSDPAAAAQVQQAQASLRHFAGAIYGARWRARQMAQLQARMVQVLGPGHEATLVLLRTRVYAMRQLERPAQALALSDELNALLARHRPHDERLAMLNRSERIGALSALGRYGDALAEGQLLLAYLQRQSPAPRMNLMRTGYNLAGLAIEMGALDDAVVYAELSLREGSQASLAEGGQETLFSRMLLHQARALRGDTGALDDLKAVLDKVYSWDLPGLSILASLQRLAHAAGQTGVRDWALARMAEVSMGAAAPLQPARAWPLMLQADAAPPGSALALDAAARALAHGLASEDRQAAVGTSFALARQVAGPTASQPSGAAASGAIWLYKRGANALLQLRAGLPQDGAGAALPRTWLAEHEPALRQLAGLLIDSGRLKEAEQAIEVLRNEELHEFQRRSRGQPLRRDSAAPLSLTADEQQRETALGPWAEQLRAAARDAQRRSDSAGSERARTQTADPVVTTLLDEAAAALQQLALQQPRAGAAAASPGLHAPSALPRLPQGHARLAFLLREEGTELLLRIGHSQRRIRLPQGSTAISRQVQALRADLVRPGNTVPAAAQTLHRWLLQPVAASLRGIRHLQVVPDGVLRYVPFAALHDGRHYLVQRHSVSVQFAHQPARAAAGAALKSGAVRQPLLVAFGRTQPDAGHSALPGVQHELAALRALRGARVASHQDQQFTEIALRSALARAPQVVHLASHFVLDSAGEEASYLLLGDGTRLPLRALRELPWAGVQLALLSACDSGLALDAGTSTQGRELAGFAATLHGAGVKNVLATLWRVDDAATARWMRAFYAPWRDAAAPPALSAQHLARTQRRWLQQHAGTPQAHPHHWAAFSWMGAPA